MPAGSSMRAAIGTLILATSIVQLANGFFGTFFSLRVAVEGFGPTTAGLVLSSFFAGFTIGALRCGAIIDRVGHIRAYAAFAGIVAAATAALPLWVDALPWIVLRAAVGFGCAGLFTTTESWLTAKAAPEERGRVFSVYMVGIFIALALGQILIGWVEIGSSAPFNAIVVLFALALLMVSTTRADPPSTVASEPLPWGQLSRAAPVAVLGGFTNGVVSGSFYALVPAWLEGRGVDRPTIALLMVAAVLGGLTFQVPVGRLSDRMDRRRVMAGIAVGLALAAIALVLLPRQVPVALPAIALLGGFLSTIYPVCVAHAHDRMPADRVVAVSGRLILVSGVGSVLGPLLGSQLTPDFGIDGVLYLMAGAALLLAVVAGASSLRPESVPQQERTFEILTPQATALAHDPEAPSGSDEAPVPIA